MITLTVNEIIKKVKTHLDYDVVFSGADDLRNWMLYNRYDNHSWLEMNKCHLALHAMLCQGYLFKMDKNQYAKNPLYIEKKT